MVSYFETNCHLIRHEWANSFLTTNTFGNRTNNRLEYINQKIKSVCSSFANLGVFFRELRTIIACLRVERDSVALNCISKVSVHAIGDSVSAQYSRHLLPYPAGLVRTELCKSDAVCIEDDLVSGETTTCSVCSCFFHQHMLLPCCHIFVIQRQQGMNLYDETLSHIRWHTARYQVVHSAFHEKTDPAAVANVTVSAVHVGPRRVPQTTHEKFRAARHFCMRLAGVVSEACGTHYDDKMKELRSLLQSWKSQSVALETQSVAPETRRIVPETPSVAPETWRVMPETRRVALAPPPETQRVAPESCTRESHQRPRVSHHRPGESCQRPGESHLHHRQRPRESHSHQRPGESCQRPRVSRQRPGESCQRPRESHLHHRQRPRESHQRPRVSHQRPGVVSETRRVALAPETRRVVPETRRVVPETPSVAPETRRVVPETPSVTPPPCDLASIKLPSLMRKRG